MPRNRKAIAERKRRERAEAVQQVKAAMEEGAPEDRKRVVRDMPEWLLDAALNELIDRKNPYGHNDPTAAQAVKRITKRELRTTHTA